MSRSIFGWSLPPGCTLGDIERQAEIYYPMCICGHTDEWHGDEGGQACEHACCVTKGKDGCLKFVAAEVEPEHE